jgi:hypothetical protein
MLRIFIYLSLIFWELLMIAVFLFQAQDNNPPALNPPPAKFCYPGTPLNLTYNLDTTIFFLEKYSLQSSPLELTKGCVMSAGTLNALTQSVSVFLKHRFPQALIVRSNENVRADLGFTKGLITPVFWEKTKILVTITQVSGSYRLSVIVSSNKAGGNLLSPPPDDDFKSISDNYAQYLDVFTLKLLTDLGQYLSGK